MKDIYIVASVRNHEELGSESFDTFEEARDYARKIVLREVEDIRQYTDPMREAGDKEKADFVESFFTNDHFFKTQSVSCDWQDGFGASLIEYSTTPHFKFASKCWGQDEGDAYFGDKPITVDFFELAIDGVLLGVSIQYKQEMQHKRAKKSSSAANNFLIYCAVDDCKPCSKEDVQAKLAEAYGVSLSISCIGDHLNKLVRMGCLKKINRKGSVKNKLLWQRLSPENCAVASPREEGVEATMSYLVLRDSDKPLLQKEIVEAIKKRFGMTPQPRTVGDHIKLLQEMGCNIAYDGKNGYKMN